MAEMRERPAQEAIETIENLKQEAKVLEAAEQQEMDVFELIRSEEEALQQQEMDAFAEENRIDDSEDGEEKGKLGEYRIFADTRPRVSGYDIFADGK